MTTLTRQFELEFDGDVYIARLRAAYPELMLNLGYNGIQIVDVATGRLIQKIMFPDGIADFSIYTWLVSPDGARSYLFSGEPLEFALEVDHTTGLVGRVTLPGNFEPPTGLCWFAPNLYMRDYYGRNWALRNGTVVEADQSAAPEPLRSRLRLDIPGQSLTVRRLHYPYGGAYVRSKTQMGFVSFLSTFEQLLPLPDSVIDVALAPRGLFVCEEQSVSLQNDRERQVILPSRSGEYFMGIESLSVNQRTHLLVLSAKYDCTGDFLQKFAIG
jgi:hypothetical protein